MQDPRDDRIQYCWVDLNWTLTNTDLKVAISLYPWILMALNKTKEDIYNANVDK